MPLKGAEDRDSSFHAPAPRCYKGMIVGEPAARRPSKLQMSARPSRSTNIRSAGAESARHGRCNLQSRVTLDARLEYIAPELLEVTPESNPACGKCWHEDPASDEPGTGTEFPRFLAAVGPLTPRLVSLL